ncbi:transposase [Agromyces sp. SYSU K20354]|uniref:transposase n=1 Tax=Agromyces cavernae TaxID=2898659 RepID=UPI001E36ACBD|nr:transposase [Agromyces cavernae]MCD2442988.1 transposase [Agromyces cavernae]
MPGDALTEIAAELYGLLPDEFTAARNERGRAARGDDRDLAARIQDLKRPSPAAWLVNQLVRHRSAELDTVLELGADLRAAQDDLDAAQLAQLTKQRRQLVAAIAREAGALAEELGNPVRGPVLDQVAQTLQAAMSDVAATAAVRTGRLVRGLEAVGLEVDLDGAVAGEVPETPGSGGLKDDEGASRNLARSPGGRGAGAAGATRESREERAAREAAEARERAARAADDAEQLADEASDQLTELDARVADLQRATEERTAARDELEAQLRRADDELAETERELRAVTRDRDRAARAATAARRSADDAREALEALEG